MSITRFYRHCGCDRTSRHWFHYARSGRPPIQPRSRRRTVNGSCYSSHSLLQRVVLCDLSLSQILVIALAKMHGPLGILTEPEIQHLDDHRERHREIRIALRHMHTEPLGEQVRPDEDQKRERKHLD